MSTMKPIQLYTAGTPNGHRVTCFLEELKTIYNGPEYDLEKIDIFIKNTQKERIQEPWFIKLNPNGRIPVIVDPERNNFVVFESAAILLYLQQHYDKDDIFGWDPAQNPEEYSQALQWIFFAHGGIAPMQSQLNYFTHFASEDIPYAKKRYWDETKRLYSVLEIGLTGHEWLVGNKYSIADINVLPMVNSYEFSGIPSLDEWPNVKAWLERARARPGFAVGASIPTIP